MIYLWFLFGVIVGVIIHAIVFNIIFPPAGILHVDRSDPVADRYNLVITVPIDDIPKKKHVTFDIQLDDKESK